MNKRSLIIAMIFSSIFGGLVVLIGASFVLPEQQVIQQTSEQSSPVSLTNYVFDSADFIVPDGLNFVFAARNATPSVVHIRTSYSSGDRANSPFNEFFKDYFGERRGGISRGAGSGVIISPDGYIATNNHVIENADEIEVVLNDNRSYNAEVIGYDETTDLAVLKIDEENLQSIKYGDSETINIGEWVLAIGNPFEFRSTVTAGIVSAKGRNINILESRYRVESFIQTDAAVNPGNSGGALVNLRGELVGINTAIASPSGAFAGYSFAVPVSLVKKVVSDLVEYGTVQRALLGIEIRDVNSEIAEEYGLDLLKGVYISGVARDNAADLAGIRQGDVIVAIDDNPVNNVAQLQEKIAVKRPGDEVVVQFYRDGKQREARAKLRNSKGTMDIIEVASKFEFGGATFEDVSDELLDKLNLGGGVQITSLEEGKWKDVKMKKGFIITGIDNENIRNIQDLRRYFERPRTDGILIEGIYPDGSKAHYGLGL